MHKRLRIGVIGTGFGAAVHVPVFHSLPNIELVAIAGRRVAKAQQIASQFQIPNACSGYEELLALPLDAVSIAVPPVLSGEIFQAARRRKLHILAEKPLCHEPRLMEKLRSQPVETVEMVDYQFPELPAFQNFKSLLDDGCCGPVRFINSKWLVHSYAEKHGINNWKRHRGDGGGVLNLLGTHLLYNIEHFFGRISSVLAAVPTYHSNQEISDAEHTVSFVLQLISGATVTAVLSNAAPMSSIHQIEAICDRGTMTLENRSTDYMRGFQCRVADQFGTRELGSAQEGHQVEEDGRAVAFRQLAQRFIDTIGQPPGSRRIRPGFEDDARICHHLQCIRELAFTSTPNCHSDAA